MLLINNARYLEAPVDLLIDKDKIVTMTPAGHVEYPRDCETFDAKNFLLFPSFIDCHIHLREPGFEYKESIKTGLDAAVHGGFGTVMCMANTKPVNDNAPVTEFIISEARKSHPHGPAVYPIAAATMGLNGEALTPLAELNKAGCKAVSNDGKPIASTEMVRRIMEYASDLGMIFIDHCEDPWLAKGWIMNEGQMSSKLGVRGQPAMGEALQAMRDIMLAQYLNLPVHIAHVSSALTLEMIAWGKEQGIKVTAETCPHYLLLDESALAHYNPKARVSPPLRTPQDREALRKAVKSGLIDILATDHAPHAAYELDDTLDNIPSGFTGLDLAVSLCWRLVQEGVLSEADLVRLWHNRPAEIFSFVVNNFNPGDPASFFLFDPHLEWQANPENFHSKSHNTPFLNESLKGKVQHHWLNGVKIF